MTTYRYDPYLSIPPSIQGVGIQTCSANFCQFFSTTGSEVEQYPVPQLYIDIAVDIINPGTGLAYSFGYQKLSRHADPRTLMVYDDNRNKLLSTLLNKC